MPTISFFRSADGTALGNSGVGGYGSAFNQSVNVGNFQDLTYVTDAGGTQQGIALSNVKWAHANSGYVNGANLLNLLSIPNTDATLNIRFTHTSATTVSNAKIWVTDSNTTTGIPAGLTARLAEIRHTGISQVANGVGNASWSQVFGTGYLSLTSNPGSGLQATGGVLAQADWFIGLTLSPDSIGSKLGRLRVQLEYS